MPGHAAANSVYDSVKCINAVRLTKGYYNYLKSFDFQAGMGV